MKSIRKQVALLALAAIAILALGYGVYCPATPRSLRPGDARAKYERIHEGMAEAQIVHIMAVPAGDYTSGPVEFPFCGTGLPMVTYREHDADDEFTHLSWTWDDGSVSVWLDRDGVVSRKSFTPVLQPRSFIHRASDWLASWRRR